MNRTTEVILEDRVKKIESRNKRVEQDKQWETSWTRRIAITVMTYILVFVYLYIVENPAPMINALVPAAGFLLSTLALGWLRELWYSSIN